MTTLTTAEVGHGSKEPTVVEIDGFRGRLISTDQPPNSKMTGYNRGSGTMKALILYVSDPDALFLKMLSE